MALPARDIEFASPRQQLKKRQVLCVSIIISMTILPRNSDDKHYPPAERMRDRTTSKHYLLGSLAKRVKVPSNVAEFEDLEQMEQQPYTLPGPRSMAKGGACISRRNSLHKRKRKKESVGLQAPTQRQLYLAKYYTLLRPHGKIFRNSNYPKI
jgi:hypothetical protein